MASCGVALHAEVLETVNQQASSKTSYPSRRSHQGLLQSHSDGNETSTIAQQLRPYQKNMGLESWCLEHPITRKDELYLNFTIAALPRVFLRTDRVDVLLLVEPSFDIAEIIAQRLHFALFGHIVQIFPRRLDRNEFTQVARIVRITARKPPERLIRAWNTVFLEAARSAVGI